MKTYLVTGAAGFIGANYIKFLLEKKYKHEDIKVIVSTCLHTQAIWEQLRMTSTTSVVCLFVVIYATAT